jgi:hypothetical protein
MGTFPTCDWLRAGRSGFDSRQEQELFFSSPLYPDRQQGPTGSKMSGALPPTSIRFRDLVVGHEASLLLPCPGIRTDE